MTGRKWKKKIWGKDKERKWQVQEKPRKWCESEMKMTEGGDRIWQEESERRKSEG